MRHRWDDIPRWLGGILALLSCIPMLAMLPAGFSVILSLGGLATPLFVAWMAPLAPIAPWLFVLSIVLVTVGHSRCGWQPASLAVAGGLLIYLAMYVFITPLASDAMTNMGQTTSIPKPAATMAGMAGPTNAPLFYMGLLLLVGSYGFVWWRRRQQACQPVSLPMARPTP